VSATHSALLQAQLNTVDNHDRFFVTVVSQSHHFHQSHELIGETELIHPHFSLILKVAQDSVQEQVLLLFFVAFIEQSSLSLFVQTTRQDGVLNKISV
jgi:hypothetical protein